MHKPKTSIVCKLAQPFLLAAGIVALLQGTVGILIGVSLIASAIGCEVMVTKLARDHAEPVYDEFDELEDAEFC